MSGTRPATPAKTHLALWAGIASMVTVAVLIAAKGFAYAESGSASVLASLMDSLVDATVSVMNYLAIRMSVRPADHDHRFGHGKIEGLAALGQAALIALGAGILVWEAWHRFGATHEIGEFGLSTAVMAFAIIASLGLVAIQNYALRHAPSLAVEADREHYAMDIAVNAGVIGVMGILYLGGPDWVDPAFALLIAGYLLFVVYRIGGKALDMLLDRELDDETRRRIVAVVTAHPGVMGLHDLRTYRSGMRTFISFDIEADPDLRLSEAHEIVRAAEHALLNVFPDAEIMIHVDPHGDPHDSRHKVADIHGRRELL